MIATGVGGLGVAAMAIIAGVELVDHGVLPGQSLLDQIDGACELDVPTPRFGPVGSQIDGSFYSKFRHKEVGYSIGFPAGFESNRPVPLIVFLHGEGSTHRCHLGVAKTPARAAALLIDGRTLPPVAIATVDGGQHYWHPYKGDDPMAMVVHEFLPLCQSHGVGLSAGSVGVMGLSMGGYGALLFAELHPRVFRATAGISPAIWTSYDEAHGANAIAYSSPGNFARYDAVTHTGGLAHTPTFVASGEHDPFYPGARAFRQNLPGTTPTTAIFDKGCHGGSFFHLHMPAALQFMSTRLHA